MNPNLDRRFTRVNRAKREGNCVDCGGYIRLWFAVQKCFKCLEQVADALDDCRHNRPSLTRYMR